MNDHATALAPLRPLLSTRIWNLLIHNGYTSIDDVRFAQTMGALKDLRGMGPAARLEIHLALDALPEEKPEPERTAKEWPWLSPRELEIILGLAEAATAGEAWTWYRNRAGSATFSEAQAALKRLREIAPAPAPSSAPPLDPEDDPASYTPESYPPEFLAADLERAKTGPPYYGPPALPFPAADDDFAGYEMD